MIKYCIVGAGRMGKTFCDELKQQVVEVVAPEAKTKTLDSIKAKFDVLIDFSSPANLEMICSYANKNPIPIVFGTTGFSNEQTEQIKQLSKNMPIVLCPNFSIGITLINKTIKTLVKNLPNNFDVCIIEEHHKYKKDSPSGTAKLFAKTITDSNSNFDVETKSIRAGNVTGNHYINFYGEDETISIKHISQSKRIFTLGAIEASKLLLKKKSGFYTFEELLFENKMEKI